MTPAPGGTKSRAREPAELHPVERLPGEWESVVETMGERAFRARQIFRWIHHRGVMDPAEMTDLPAALRERLSAAGFAEPAEVMHVHRSAGGTRKLLLELVDGARVECVLIPMTRTSGGAPPGDADAAAAVGDDDDEPEPERRRVTLCVSTQYGCAMGCVFCASGRAGLMRGIGAAGIVAQVQIARRYLDPRESLRNLVFMGMGEPLHHYDETARSIRLIAHPDGFGMGLRRITVSTVGLIPGIARLGEDFGGRIGLAVSLHAPDNETRDRLVPMNRSYPIERLIEALHRYPLPARRRITIEYTLIAGENDSVEQAKKLARLLQGLRVKVNLIPMNSIEGSPLGAPPEERVVAFREALARRGLSCFVRARRGDDVSAACGQLALLGESSR